MKMRIVRSRFCGTDGARKDYGTRCIVHHFTRKHGNEDGYSSKTQMIFWGTSGNWKLRVESLEIDKNLNHTHTRHKPIKQLTTIRDNFISVQNHPKWSKTKGYGVRWTCKMKLLSWSEGTNLVLSFFCSNFALGFRKGAKNSSPDICLRYAWDMLRAGSSKNTRRSSGGNVAETLGSSK